MSANMMLKLREHYASLIKTLLSIGDRDHAYDCAQLAVRRGIWKDARQRPVAFNPALPQKPVYDASNLWFVPYLEEQYPTILNEVLSVVSSRFEGFSPVEDPLIGGGRWDQVMFYERGLRLERSCALFPKTVEIMSRIPEAMHSGGVVMLSWLHPNSHIVPHCGDTNERLRVHLGIKVPKGASMRVGDENIVWQEGRCVVFDDSFEHEVWNRGTEPRIVVLFDIAHPELPPTHQPADIDRPADLEEAINKFLSARGIAEVERDPVTNELTLIPDHTTALTITRYMKDLDATRVELAYGNVVID